MRIEPEKVPEQSGSRYPAPFAEPCKGRHFRRLGDAAGLTKLGVSLVRLAPGAWSGQRHFHECEDEFLYMLNGELVLVTDAGEQVVRAGDCAAWKAGDRDGHHLINRGAAEATFLAISNRDGADRGEYPDIDLLFAGNRYAGEGKYLHKDGTPY
jgi:uncharacterized cupin superfamily protein